MQAASLAEDSGEQQLQRDTTIEEEQVHFQELEERLLKPVKVKELTISQEEPEDLTEYEKLVQQQEKGAMADQNIETDGSEPLQESNADPSSKCVTNDQVHQEDDSTIEIINKKGTTSVSNKPSPLNDKTPSYAKPTKASVVKSINSPTTGHHYSTRNKSTNRNVPKSQSEWETIQDDARKDVVGTWAQVTSKKLKKKDRPRINTKDNNKKVSPKDKKAKTQSNRIQSKPPENEIRVVPSPPAKKNQDDQQDF